MDQFSSLEGFARGYRQHVTRTTIYLPTRVPRAEGSLLLFRIELADGTCAFRGEGSVESFRQTPGGEQLGLTLRMRRLDKASKELHSVAFAGLMEGSAPVAEAAVTTAGLASLADAIGAAAEQALDALAKPPSVVDAPVVVHEPVVVSRTEGEGSSRIRDDLRPVARPPQDAVTRPLDAAARAVVESEGNEQVQALGRMAVARMSVDEYEARKAAMARVSAPPPVASLTASSESTAAWSEADDALDFEGIGSDIRENAPVSEVAAPVVIVREEEPPPPSPTLPPLEGIVVAPPTDAVGGGVSLDEETFSGASAYEMPKAAPVEVIEELNLDFDFTAVAFTAEEPSAKGLSGSRPAITSSAVTAVAPALVPPVPALTPAAEVVAKEAVAAVPAPALAPSPAPAAAGPSRLPPPPPPKSGAPIVGAAAGAAATRSPVPMSKPIPKPTAEPEDKPGLFGWLRGKK